MRKLDIGNSDFKDIIANQSYYVDKSMLIKDVLDASKVTLLPRPRRFGKTLNMTMLRYFFERTGEDNSRLFKGLNITSDKNAMSHQGQYPVIFLSLKDIKATNWDMAMQLIAVEVARIYRIHEQIMPELPEEACNRWQRIVAVKATMTDLQLSLKDLISDLSMYYQKPVVVLIDEYDSPVIDAYQGGYYDEMIRFMRAWLGGGLKHVDGSTTFKAVVTGILRVTRESIFSDLNNLKISSILSPGNFADKFGFTEADVRGMLADFDLTSQIEDVQAWYNGYRFGEKVIYNPWSVVNFIDSYPAPIGPQWLNTSSNALVHQELEAGGLELKRDLEKLLNDEELRYPVTEHTIFSDIGNNPCNIWSFLYFSGYLNAVDVKRDPDTYELTYSLQIPNLEIRVVYQQFIQRYFDKLGDTRINDLLQALKQDNYPEFERHLQALVLSTLSFYDTAKQPEAIYHTFLLGLLANLHGSFRFESNAESGYGRADIVMIPKRSGLTGKIIELKSVNSGDDIDKTTEQALQQIVEKAYATRLLNAGVASENIQNIAIIIQGKHVTVKSVRHLH